MGKREGGEEENVWEGRKRRKKSRERKECGKRED
jgi:hypothetical protein